jgi:hypothetical protein
MSTPTGLNLTTPGSSKQSVSKLLSLAGQSLDEDQVTNLQSAATNKSPGALTFLKDAADAVTAESTPAKKPGVSAKKALIRAASGVHEEDSDLVSDFQSSVKSGPKASAESPTRANNRNSASKKENVKSVRMNRSEEAFNPARPSNKQVSSSAHNPFNTLAKSTDFSAMSKSQQIVLAQSKLMGKPPKSKSSTTRKSSEGNLRKSWERLSQPVPVRKSKEFGNRDDMKNCTFTPKITVWKGSEDAKEEEPEDGAKVDVTARVMKFVRQQDSKTRKTRQEKEKAVLKRDYDARLNRLQCPNCGTYQSYDEFIEKRTKCPADFCAAGSWYKPQTVFNRESLPTVKRLIKKTYGDEKGDEINLEAQAAIFKMIRGFEPSEKAVVERLMREAAEDNMTDIQKQARDARVKAEKLARKEAEKAKIAEREKFIKMQLDAKRTEELELENKLQEDRALWRRKMHSANTLDGILKGRFEGVSKGLPKAMVVEYSYSQPVNKIVERKEEVDDPDDPDGLPIEVTVERKEKYYDDDDDDDEEDGGGARSRQANFFARLADDIADREAKAKERAEKRFSDEALERQWNSPRKRRGGGDDDDDEEEEEDGGNAFLERLERDVAKIYNNYWADAIVLKSYTSGRGSKGEELYDIEFVADESVLHRVKRNFLKHRRKKGGDDDEDDEEEEEEEEEEEVEEDDDEGESKDNFEDYAKRMVRNYENDHHRRIEEYAAAHNHKPIPRRSKLKPFAVGAKVSARKPENNPGPQQYNVFRAEDPRCGPVIVAKLNRRMRAIKGYIEAAPEEKKESLKPLLLKFVSYARQKKQVEEVMRWSGLRIDDLDKKEEGKHGSDSEDEDEE